MHIHTGHIEEEKFEYFGLSQMQEKRNKKRFKQNGSGVCEG
jgi:hypothetical protein